MNSWTRRTLLKSGIAATAATVTNGLTLVALGEGPVVDSTDLQPMASGASVASPRERLLLDENWFFALGNAADPARDFDFGKAARERSFAKSGKGLSSALAEKIDTTRWKPVTLPHDWALDLPFISTPPMPEQGGKEFSREYPATSVGWYHRVFHLAKSDEGKRITLEFDGAMRSATVFFNGHYIGENFSGYAPFSFDVTDWINLDANNTLVVRLDVSYGESWFYEGAGLYRHVWLIKTPPVHLTPYQTVLRSTVANKSASVKIASEVSNGSDQPRSCSVSWEIFDADSKLVARVASPAKSIEPWASVIFEGTAPIANAKLWSCETPHLYSAVATVQVGSEVMDRQTESFGVRTIRFDADKGFFLNDKPVKIKGTCNHQDHAGVGAALPDRLQAYRLERLKSMGSNACRTSHNPPTPEFLDAADRVGMLVMCETRMMDANPEGLSELSRMISRFRNHPSIIIWSLGNEEPEQGTTRGAKIATTMKRLAKKLDPTRPTTIAMNGQSGKGVSAVVDVQGFNYYEGAVEPFHAKFPTQPCVGTETASTLCTRGIYANDPTAGYMSAYDVNKPAWGALAETWWKFYDERPFLAGGFAWTGFDYRGEPTPYHWPCISSHFGIMDTCGFPKDNYFYYRAWWQPEPALHLFPHWNWEGRESQEIAVWVHSNLDSVELLLNGRSLGVQPVKRNTHLEWKVKYAPGVLEARGTKGGKVVLTEKRETTGKPAKLRLSADRSPIDANGEDVSVVTLEVLDAQDRIVPIAGNLVTFQLAGAGKLIGVGNGDPSCHESDRGPTRSAFNGLCMAFVQASKVAGELRLDASADGLQAASVTISAKSAVPRPFLA